MELAKLYRVKDLGKISSDEHKVIFNNIEYDKYKLFNGLLMKKLGYGSFDFMQNRKCYHLVDNDNLNFIELGVRETIVPSIKQYISAMDYIKYIANSYAELKKLSYDYTSSILSGKAGFVDKEYTSVMDVCLFIADETQMDDVRETNSSEAFEKLLKHTHIHSNDLVTKLLYKRKNDLNTSGETFKADNVGIMEYGAYSNVGTKWRIELDENYGRTEKMIDYLYLDLSTIREIPIMVHNFIISFHITAKILQMVNSGKASFIIENMEFNGKVLPFFCIMVEE